MDGSGRGCPASLRAWAGTEAVLVTSRLSFNADDRFLPVHISSRNCHLAHVKRHDVLEIRAHGEWALCSHAVPSTEEEVATTSSLSPKCKMCHSSIRRVRVTRYAVRTARVSCTCLCYEASCTVHRVCRASKRARELDTVPKREEPIKRQAAGSIDRREHYHSQRSLVSHT